MLLTTERLGRRTTPVRSTDHVGHSVVGYIVEDDHGWLAIPLSMGHVAEMRDSFDAALDYLRRTME